MKSNLIILISFILFTGLYAKSDAFMKDYFEYYGIDGSVVLENLNSDRVFIRNHEKSTEKYLPASTFKILNTLIALEEKAVKDENELISWDGQDKGLEIWNHDQCIRTAFPISCVWFYQELAKKIGNTRYLEYLQKTNYGNALTGPNLDSFWLDGDLRISVKEQISFLKKLYSGKLPFNPQSIQIVKNLMLTDKTDKYQLYAKTGWAQRVSPQIGWYVGFIETKNDTWFFACNLKIQKPGDEKQRKEIVYAALKSAKIID